MYDTRPTGECPTPAEDTKPTKSRLSKIESEEVGAVEESPSASRDTTFDPLKEQNQGRNRRHRNANLTQSQREAALFNQFCNRQNAYFQQVRGRRPRSIHISFSSLIPINREVCVLHTSHGVSHGVSRAFHLTYDSLACPTSLPPCLDNTSTSSDGVRWMALAPTCDT
eukprot:276112-Prorocentrum_minimum.AAC.1